MIYYISFFLIMLNLLNLFSSISKKVIPIFTMLFYWVLVFGNNGNPDYLNYRNIYVTQNSPDIGFNLLVKFFNMLGFDYTLFLATISSICFILIYITVNKYINNSSYLLILYFFYPLIIDVIQIRNFMVMSLLIFAIPYLLEKSYKGIIYYCIIMLIASSIQITALIYIPFIFFLNIASSSRKLIFFFIGLFIFVIASFNPSFLNLIGELVGGITDQDRLMSVLKVKTSFGFFIPWMFTTANFIVIKLSYSFVSKSSQNIEQKHDNFMRLILDLSVYSFLFLPFYVFNLEFMRFLRNLYILYYLYFSVFNIYAIKKSRGKILYNSMIISVVLMNFTFEILSLWGRGLDHIFYPVFRNNFIF